MGKLKTRLEKFFQPRFLLVLIISQLTLNNGFDVPSVLIAK